MTDPRCRAGTVHHVSFRIDDLEESLAFYEEVLGCTRLERPTTLPVSGAWLQAGATQVHLIEHAADEATGSAPTRVVSYANHVAFGTDDIDAAKEAFRERGVEVRESRSGLPQFFVSDPSGNVIEFIRAQP